MLDFSELSSYSLIDFIPMEKDVYFRLFERLHEAMLPYQLIPLILSLFIVFRIWQRKNRFVLTFLGLVVTWVGFIFFFKYLQEVSWVAPYFGWMFIAQGVLMVLTDIVFLKHRVNVQHQEKFSTVGVSLVLFSLIVFPVVVGVGERSWQGTEVYGATPDVTMLFTLSILLLYYRVPIILMLIPVAWCLVSGAIWFALEWYVGVVVAVLGMFCLLVGLYLRGVYYWRRRVAN